MTGSKRILVVDDDASSRLLLSRILMRSGHEVLLASTGEDGLALLSRGPVALIVSDQTLPGIHGSEFLRRAALQQPGVRAVVISGSATPEVVRALSTVGVVGALTKPYSPEEALQLCERALALGPGGPNLQQALEEFIALVAIQRVRPLDVGEAAALEFLRDVLLEAGLTPSAAGAPFTRRHARSSVVVEVSFQTAADAVRAVTKEVGLRGLAVQTALALPVGATVQLSLQVPVLELPLEVAARVVWARPGELGFEFQSPSLHVSRHLRQLVSEHRPFLERLRLLVGNQAESPADVRVRPVVFIALQDAALLTGVRDVLEFVGFETVSGTPALAPSVVVADVALAGHAMQRGGGTPLIIVGASSIDAVSARIARLRPAAFVPRPVTVSAILGAVRRVAALVNG